MLLLLLLLPMCRREAAGTLPNFSRIFSSFILPFFIMIELSFFPVYTHFMKLVIVLSLTRAT